jgi:hypothetical protein
MTLSKRAYRQLQKFAFEIRVLFDTVLNSTAFAISRLATRQIEGRTMAQDDFNPRLGRIRDARRARAQRHAALVIRQAGKHGARALRQRGHISPATPKRGMGAGVRAAAGLIAPGSRRVIVKARYTRIVGGDLGAARAHI